MSYNPKTWNYDRPINMWESWPWWVRWPGLAIIALYFIGGFLAPLFWVLPS